MTYRDFYKIAEYMNECNNNIFSNEEVACYAYDYMQEYELSYEYSEPTINMISLCYELTGKENILDIETMEKVFDEFLEKY